MGKLRSVRAKENIKCDKCGELIGDGDMYLLNEEENLKICHFCNYKMQQKKQSSEESQKTKTGDMKKAMSRLDELIEERFGKKEE